MKNFDYYQPTKIAYGCGRLSEVGKIVAQYGKRCLLVSVPAFPEIEPVYDKVKALLQDANVAVAHFDGVIPNPTIATINAGTNVAKAHRADVVLGLGGGSSMDAAKAIAVEATHEGSCWDYLFYKQAPTEKTLPIIAVTTTSGTGSHVTQVAVVTNTAEKDKSALYNDNILPRVAVVDPELMLTVPPKTTACTGFDVFAHAFESFIHPAGSPYTDLLAKEAMTLVVNNLPSVVQEGSNLEGRKALAWADTLSGLCIKSAGVTLPHGIGMAIGGMYPHVAHGEALALVYPEFMRYTFRSAVSQFAAAGRLLNPDQEASPDETAAEASCGGIENFLKQIGLWKGLKDVAVPENELDQLAHASMVLPDYKNNPRIAGYEEMRGLLQSCYASKR
ncbi:MAG: iron-containing alcohol dehydrogenase [SAR324 cluster bacterium]|nr:iron-containing alcohol dehydrogenase [SAR324 cluster bacterium]